MEVLSPLRRLRQTLRARRTERRSRRARVRPPHSASGPRYAWKSPQRKLLVPRRTYLASAFVTVQVLVVEDRLAHDGLRREAERFRNVRGSLRKPFDVDGLLSLVDPHGAEASSTSTWSPVQYGLSTEEAAAARGDPTA